MSALLYKQTDINLFESEDLLTTLGKTLTPGNTLLVTSQSFTRRGLTQKVSQKIKTEDKGAAVLTLDSVNPNPDIFYLQQQARVFHKHQIENVLAIGGGSVIDSAKILCALLENDTTDLVTLLINNQHVSKSSLNLIAVPTTSGTGAEVTPFATAWDKQQGKKYSLNGITPDTVILDPGLTLSLSVKDTLYPAMDALSHSLESLWNKNRTERSEKYAEQAIIYICEALPIVLSDLNNYAARRQLQIAATLAGFAIAETRTAIAHAISYPLTAKHGVPHGLACSFTLAAIVRSIGRENLKISQDLINTVLKLLDNMHLADDIEQYIDWPTLLDEASADLEPSRSQNFILPIKSGMIEDIVLKSKCALQE